MVFDKVKDMIRTVGYDPSLAVLTQSFIRAEAPMNTTSSSFNLPILTNQQQAGTVATYPTENKLQQTDAFVVSDMAIYCCVPASATDTDFLVHSFPSPEVFTTAGAAKSVNAAYSNGQLQILINNKNILPALDLLRFLRAPVTQAGTNPLLAYSGATTVLANVDSVDFSQDGRDPFEPNLVLAGNDNPSVRIVLPGAMAVAQANARWIWFARGILAQNVSKISGTSSNR